MRFKETTERLIGHAEAVAARSYVPYSSCRRSAALLVAGGGVVPGVRVENASFSLTIPALVNAFGTAVSLASSDVLAVALNEPAGASEQAFLHKHPFGPYDPVHEQFYVRRGVDKLPEPGELLDPTRPVLKDRSPDAIILAARAIASRAYIPESRFPVGCLIELEGGDMVYGVNVENPEWPFILCAERNALGTMISYGLSGVRNIYVSCPTDELASPCGACRQVMVELAPEGTVWMDRGNENVASAGVDELLPGHFSGRALTRKA